MTPQQIIAVLCPRDPPLYTLAAVLLERPELVTLSLLRAGQFIDDHLFSPLVRIASRMIQDYRRVDRQLLVNLLLEGGATSVAALEIELQTIGVVAGIVNRKAVEAALSELEGRRS